MTPRLKRKDYKHVQVHIPIELLERARKWASKRGLSIAQMCRQGLEQTIERFERHEDIRHERERKRRQRQIE